MDEVDGIIRKDLVNPYTEGYVTVGPEETTLPIYYTEYAESINNFSVRDSDVIVASYPKSGTTWTQEMVWLIMNDCDFEGAKVNLQQRFPLLEMSTLVHFKKIETTVGIKLPEYLLDSVEFVKKQQSPRFIKTHLAFPLLPQEIQNGSKSPKIIYVTRNPKDVCVSYFHHGKILQGWQGSFENFCKVFLAERTMYGSFWKHVVGYWKQRTLPNLLIVTYEEMKRDLPSAIRKVAAFLGKTLTEQQIEMLTKHLSFASMKDNEAINFHSTIMARRAMHSASEDGVFLRSGTTGKHKEEMSPEVISEFDARTKERFAGTGFDKEYNYIL